MALKQSLEPVRTRDAVPVGEDDGLSFSERRTCVSRLMGRERPLGAHHAGSSGLSGGPALGGRLAFRGKLRRVDDYRFVLGDGPTGKRI